MSSIEVIIGGKYVLYNLCVHLLYKDQRHLKTKKGSFLTASLFNAFAASNGLLTQTELFNDGTISGDVAILQVVQQRTAFSYQHCQGSFSTIIFSVELKVLSQVGNTV